MRGQTVVTDASISVDRSKDYPGVYVISIVPKDGIKERFLYFNNVDKLINWTYALECVAKYKPRFGARDPPDTTLAPEPTTDDENQNLVEQAMKNHLAVLGLTADDAEDRLARLSARTFSRLRISVQASTEYNVSTIDPQGDDTDRWATLRATYLQRFRITGGAIVRGEEIVQVGVSECPDADNLENNNTGMEGDEILSPSSRIKLMRRRRSR
jgi:hypothetical protein